MFDLSTSDEFPFKPSFFSSPPFRSYFFVCDTLLLVVTLSILGVVIVSDWSRLSTISIYWLGLVGFSMVAIWVFALRCYRRIHDVYRSGEDNPFDDGSLVVVAMSSAAGMIHWGLFFAYMMTAGTLMQLARVLANR